LENATKGIEVLFRVKIPEAVHRHINRNVFFDALAQLVVAVAVGLEITALGDHGDPPGAISAVAKRSIGVVHIIEVRAKRVGHALFTQAIVVVDHGDGSAKGLSARSVDGNNVASAKT